MLGTCRTETSADVRIFHTCYLLSKRLFDYYYHGVYSPFIISMYAESMYVESHATQKGKINGIKRVRELYEYSGCAALPFASFDCKLS